MQLRRLLATLNLGLFLVGIVLLYYYPQYTTPIFYALLAWTVVSLSLFLGRSLDRPVGGRPSAAGGPPGPGTSGPRVPLDFCVYCGTPLTAGATICSACGRAAVPV